MEHMTATMHLDKCKALGYNTNVPTFYYLFFSLSGTSGAIAPEVFLLFHVEHITKRLQFSKALDILRMILYIRITAEPYMLNKF